MAAHSRRLSLFRHADLREKIEQLFVALRSSLLSCFIFRDGLRCSLEIARLDAMHRARFWDGLFGVLRAFMKTLPWLGGAAGFSISTYFVAGRSTTVNADVRGWLHLLIEAGESKWPLVVLTGILVISNGFWLRLRAHTNKRLGRHIRELEEEINKAKGLGERLSSGLTETGAPRDEDEQ
jgi:hypothetical protein